MSEVGQSQSESENGPKLLGRYNVEATICKSIMKRIRILLRELSQINLRQVSAICEHCQRSSEGTKCKRCEYIANKFKCCNVQMGERDRRLGIWMSKIKELQELLSESVTEANFEELKRISKELYPSVAPSVPRISDWVDTVVRPPKNTPASTLKPNEPKSDVYTISKKTTVSKMPSQKGKSTQGRPAYATESPRKKSEKARKVSLKKKTIDITSRETLQNPLNSMRGILTYQLSDKRFIENGWTILPSMVTEREYGIYKMSPVKPPYDWKALNRCKGVVYYDTGEILAEFKDNGAVTWYYRNRRIALVYNGPEGSEQCSSMYVLYSHKVNTRKKQSVLAKFDYCGSGVVYDHQGNERLKYNQDSGEIFDKKIVHPATVWRWHNLNEPPIYVTRFVDTYEKNPNPVLTKNINQNEDTYQKKAIDEMAKISLENFAKQHCITKLELHTVRIKKFSVNEFFWLSVIKQSKIILRFNDGYNNIFELDLGMVIHHDSLLRKEAVLVSSETVMPCRP